MKSDPFFRYLAALVLVLLLWRPPKRGLQIFQRPSALRRHARIAPEVQQSTGTAAPAPLPAELSSLGGSKTESSAAADTRVSEPSRRRRRGGARASSERPIAQPTGDPLIDLPGRRHSSASISSVSTTTKQLPDESRSESVVPDEARSESVEPRPADEPTDRLKSDRRLGSPSSDSDDLDAPLVWENSYVKELADGWAAPTADVIAAAKKRRGQMKKLFNLRRVRPWALRDSARQLTHISRTNSSAHLSSREIRMRGGSLSQGGQELALIDRYLGCLNQTGTFLEIGARDGLAHSNTYATTEPFRTPVC